VPTIGLFVRYRIVSGLPVIHHHVMLHQREEEDAKQRQLARELVESRDGQDEADEIRLPPSAGFGQNPLDVEAGSLKCDA
jgi:hypothetical protein